MADSPVTEKLDKIYHDASGGKMQATPDILSLIISILLPLIQGCFTKGATYTTVAAAMKKKPLVASLAVRMAIAQAGASCRPDADLIYRTIVEAGKQATADDVKQLESVGEFSV